MESQQESSNLGALPSTTSRNISSSSSAFVSASQSPFFSPGPQPPWCPHLKTRAPPLLATKRSQWTLALHKHSSSQASRGPCNLEDSWRVLGPPAAPSPPQTEEGWEKLGDPHLPHPSAALSSTGRQGSSDVYMGFHGRKPSLIRFANWLRAELEIQGMSCFSADRARCKNARSHELVERAMRDAAFGVVILTKKSFANPHSIDELRSFLERKNLVPVFFDLGASDCLARDVVERRGDVWDRHGGELWTQYGGDERQWRDAVNGLARLESPKLEAHEGNWRDCVMRSVVLLATKLGRRSAVERVNRWRQRAEKGEFPFPRMENFVGRKKELSELELILFGDVHGDGQKEYFELKTRRRRRNPAAAGKGKEPIMWKESEREIEMQKVESHTLGPRTKGAGHHGRWSKSTSIMYGKGIACISGEAGIGKTELLLEYAYRFSQRYKMVLWLGGESRHVRQNYLNLRSFLEVDVSVESGSLERGRARCFEEQEEDAVARVRRELMRDIPFLIVIDNLEREEDWFDRKSIMDLLPRFGGEAHIIISTRLPRVMNLEPMKLSYLSGVEAMALMKGSLKDYPAGELDALRAMEERLGRLTLGLSIVGSILSELPISPSRLLDTVNRTPARYRWSDGGDPSLPQGHPFFTQLLDVCLFIFNHAGGPRNLAARMVQVSGWFAPAAVPIPLLALAAHRIREKPHGGRLWRQWASSMSCGLAATHVRRSEDEASSMLVRFGIARGCTKPACLHFHDDVKLYARRLAAGDAAALAAVRAVSLQGSVSLHPDHIWAACFLLFGFGVDPVVVKLAPSELLLFVKRALLRLCTAAVEAAAETLISRNDDDDRLDGPACCARASAQTAMRLWQDLVLLPDAPRRAVRRGGRTHPQAIFIRTSISGEHHPDTVAARETLSKLTRLLTKAHLS
ncbi:unnamed protein product [Spirodela intermedia]|uniref:AAA+ ATPase domain-containing protein n=1 Tax=Spirodela intermedia TaxID=51605 RepID=A0A7I8J8K9_SPIIN|nr:unnamed protein product [Spirodela intermedia]CAA6666517.1 unnamed protein product [Spirodela intermedia]